MSSGLVTSSDRDLYGIDSSAFGGIAGATITKNLDMATTTLEGYFAGQFKLPLTAVGADFKAKAVAIADWFLLCQRGFNPDSPIDSVVRTKHDDAIKWAELVRAGKVTPNVTDSSDGAAPWISTANPQVHSDDQRGWSTRGTSETGQPFDGSDD